MSEPQTTAEQPEHPEQPEKPVRKGTTKIVDTPRKPKEPKDKKDKKEPKDKKDTDENLVLKKAVISKRPKKPKNTPYAKALAVATKEIKEQASEEAKLSCPHCEKKFPTEKLAISHRTLNVKSCIGQWYVCKRCLRVFDCPSEIKIHQSKARICEEAIYVKQSDNKSVPPPEMISQFRLEKGTKDLGSAEAYLRNVIMRGDKTEILPTLEVCTIEHLKTFFKLIEEITSAQSLESIGILAEFSNKAGVSPEKAALIKTFVVRHTTL